MEEEVPVVILGLEVGKKSWSAHQMATPRLSMEDKKKKGDVIMCPGSEIIHFLHSSLVSNWCGPFAVIGHCCNGCKLQHLNVSRRNPEGKVAQIEHVERSKNNMLFCHGTRLPANKHHLLENGN